MEPLTESERQQLLALVKVGRPLPPHWRDRLFPPGSTPPPAAAPDDHEALRQSEARYRAIVEDQIDFVCRFRLDGALTFVNEAICRFVGLPSETLLGQSFLRYLPPEDQEHLRGLLRSATPEQPVVRAEHRAQRADGTWGWTEWINRALYDEQGRLVEFQGVGRDITERKQAETNLRVSEEHLQLALDASDAGTWSWEVGPNQARWDDRLRVLYGFPPQETPSHEAWLGRIHPEDRPRIVRRIESLVSPGGSDVWSEELRVVHPVKGIRWMAGLGRVYRDAQGEATRVAGISLDITERKRGEAALQQAHDEMKALLEALPDLVFEVDRDGRLLAAHARNPDLFYAPPKEFLGKRMAEVLPAAVMRVVDAALAEARRTGRHAGGTYPLDVPAGRCWFELSIAAKGDHRLPDARFVMLVRNITKRKTAEEALRRAHDELEQRVAERTVELRASQERFELFMRHVPAVAFLKDRRGRYVFVNEAWKTVFPETENRCVGRLDRELWPAATARQLRANDRLVMRSRRPLQVVEHVPQADGVRHWLVTKFPILNAAGQPILLGGAAVDITERRRLEEALLQISEREQRRIAQDLHDGLCQNLTGTAFLVRALYQRLAGRHRGPAEAAQRVGDLLETAIEDARRISQGLHPVPSEPEGLQHALGQLGSTVTDLFAVRCQVRCDGPVLVEDNATATHLFRIAQEAVSNAIKHGHARQVVITLGRRRKGLELAVRDNGRGLPRQLPAGRGLGLQIMQHRAAAIGATLQVNRGPHHGTIVICTVRGAGGRPLARNRQGSSLRARRAGGKPAAAAPNRSRARSKRRAAPGRRQGARGPARS